MQKKKITRNKPSLEPYLGFFFAIVTILITIAAVILVFPFLNPYPSLDPRNEEIVDLEQKDSDNIILLNSFIDARYNDVIYPKAKEQIVAELEKVRQISDPKARLNEIFVWEMKGWVRPNDNLSAVYCPNEACTYEFLTDDHSRVKANPYYDGILYPQKNPNATTMYADDPYWIAFNRVGECREYATLFAYMARKAGIESRLVRTDSHKWVEVELPDGTYYYDPWCAEVRDYYNATDGNMTFQDRWFNKIGSYEEYCHPPEPSFPISYTGFPYMLATPKYTGAAIVHTLSEGLNVTSPV